MPWRAWRVRRLRTVALAVLLLEARVGLGVRSREKGEQQKHELVDRHGRLVAKRRGQPLHGGAGLRPLGAPGRSAAMLSHLAVARGRRC